MKPEISILIPVHNTEKYLKKCIGSIIGQSFGKWELIAVNDCSTDNSRTILSEYEKRDSRIKVIDHPVNLGASRARFTGLDNASGRYVVFVDSDDWIPRNALQLLYDKIELEGADIVIGSMMKVLDRFKIFRTKPKNTPAPQNMTESIVMPELFDKYFINFFGVNLLPSYMCGKIYRRETLDKAPLRPTSFPMFEDMVFNLMLHPYLSKIGFVTETVYYYRSGGSTSTSTPHFLPTVKSQYLLKKEYIRKYNYTAAIPYVKYELINCFYSHFKNLVMLDKLSYCESQKLIAEEVRDSFYGKKMFEGIEISEKVLALASKDAARMIRIVRKDVRKEKPKHIMKKIVSRILH